MKTLAQLMDDVGFTDAALAAEVGCDRTMITRLRRRQITPSLPLAVRISEKTGVDIRMLLPESKPDSAHD